MTAFECLAACQPKCTYIWNGKVFTDLNCLQRCKLACYVSAPPRVPSMGQFPKAWSTRVLPPSASKVAACAHANQLCARACNHDGPCVRECRKKFFQCAGLPVAKGRTRLGQFPDPNVSQLHVDPNTCLSWVYDPVERSWVLTELPPDAACVARRFTPTAPPPSVFPGGSWTDQELIPGVKNLYLAVGGGVFLTLMLAMGKKRR